MVGTPHKSVDEIFLAAAELGAAARSALLDHECAGDAARRVRVERLLACHDRAGNFLREPAVADPVELMAGGGHPPTQGEALLPAGAQVGRYQIVREIASGGMGTVYEAVQEQPRRTVALKILRWGSTSPRMLRRFEHEAEVLGQLKHPGIAQIYEAGVAEVVWPEGWDGAPMRTRPDQQEADLAAGIEQFTIQPSRAMAARQPFFAMEFVAGLAIDQYATRQNMSIPDRLELIARVCDALQYAHQKGVIHRDLKPANILVVDQDAGAHPREGIPAELGARRDSRTSGDQAPGSGGQRCEPRSQTRDPSPQTLNPVPKILDFGVARTTDSDLQLTTIQTDVGQIIGTLSYMSPEQAAAAPEELDTRSDVYALGVVTYELLAGRLPVDIRRCALPEAVRAIREDEPSRLSSFSRVFRGDIETIVAKALEKDKSRRYQSAGEFAADIRRFAADQPIFARAPSHVYLFRKFARRNKPLVTGATLALVALLLGLAGTS